MSALTAIETIARKAARWGNCACWSSPEKKRIRSVDR